MNRLWLTAVLSVVIVGTASGQSRELIQLQADVVSLSSQVSQLQRTLDERNSVFQRLVEQVVDQVVGLSATLERVTGTSDNVRMSNETLSGEMRALMSSLRNDLNVMDRNIQELGVRLDAISNQVTAANTTSTGLRSPSNLFAQAEGDYYAGNYELAHRGFREFINMNPNSPQAVDAQMYLGNMAYDGGEYEQAILEYDILVQSYPNNSKKADALYKKALAHSALGESQTALDLFRQVVSDFPQSSAASLAQDLLIGAEGGP